ncbi:MAG: FHA domain-containing protein [Desulforhopalus sp.]
MPVIVINFKGKRVKEHSVIIGEGCSIGRKKGNDIVIDNLAVSGFHAQIDSVSTTFVLRDLESTNGTFVNDKRITMHSLKHNDTILIGKHELTFDCSDLESMQANESDLSNEKTRILDTNDLRELAGWTKEESSFDWYSRSRNPDTTKLRNGSFFSRIFQKFFE